MHKTKRILAIIAGGSGSRVALFTGANYIPKLLLNVGGHTILAKILTAEKQFDLISITLATKEHIDMVSQYVNMNFDESIAKKCKYILHDKFDGSANAVQKTFAELYVITNENADVLLHWCDIYVPVLNNMVEGLLNVSDNCICSATMNEKSRRHLYLDEKNHRIVDFDTMSQLIKHGIYSQNAARTIFGVYAIPAALYQTIMTKCQNGDNGDFATIMPTLCDTLAYCNVEQPSFDKVEIYGDTNAYLDYCDACKKEKEVRYFNKIDIKDDIVEKTALCERGYRLMNNEVAWYQICAGHGIKCVPKLFSQGEHSFIMTKIDGSTVKEYIDNVDPKCEYNPLAIGLLSMFENQICNTLHTLQNYNLNIIDNPGTDIKLTAMLEEYVNTTKSRYNEISELVKHINIYNSTLLPKFDDLMNRIEAILHKTAKTTKFCFLHGDPHVCNMMIDDAGTTLTCIDPRGYFGSGKYNKTGDADYDIAKFAFGLSGNSNFARDAFHTLKYIKHDCGEIEIQSSIRGYDLDKLPLTNRQKFLVGLCWFKFPAWLKNNPVEAIITYCHGAIMTDKYLTAWENELI